MNAMERHAFEASPFALDALNLRSSRRSRQARRDVSSRDSISGNRFSAAVSPTTQQVPRWRDDLSTSFPSRAQVRVVEASGR